MLETLCIRDLAIVDKLDVQFSNGFNVVTGETGAGKSILIKALQIISGAKAGANHIRAGAEFATVSAEFVAKKNDTFISELEELGIEIHDSDVHPKCIEIALRRKIQTNGKSQAWINDTPVRISTLKNISSQLIDIFAQHETHSLLNESTHITTLDQFISADIYQAFKQSYNEAYALFKKINSELSNLQNHTENVEYLQFRLEKINEFAPSLDDYEKVKMSTKAQSLQAKKIEAFSEIAHLLGIGDSEFEASSPISDTASKLAAKLETYSEQDESFIPYAESASSFAEAIAELSYKIETQIHQFSQDEDTFENSQTRLAGYQDFFRKWQSQNIEEFISKINEMKNQCLSIEDKLADIEILLNKLKLLINNLEKNSQKLSKAREDTAKKLSKKIEKELGELAMPGAKFQVCFDAIQRSIPCPESNLLPKEIKNKFKQLASTFAEISEHGAEHCRFLFCANKGEKLAPLSKVASGGEVSRIMLALKQVLSTGAESCLLVFDEIDSGISGRVAHIVGDKIATLSRNVQVLCVSHLAQVACYAAKHFTVNKQTKQGRTTSSMRELSIKEREQELARILSGDKITAASLKNAKELLSTR